MCISYVYLICKHIKVLDLQIYRGDLEATAQRSFRRNAAVVTSSARPGRPGRVCTSPSPDTSWGLERCDRVKPLMRCMWCMWCVWWRNVISEEFKWNGWSRRLSTFCTAHPGWREGRPALSQAPHRPSPSGQVSSFQGASTATASTTASQGRWSDLCSQLKLLSFPNHLSTI